MSDDKKREHDIKGDLHALTAGLEAIKLNWSKNPELCSRILELMKEKLELLQKNITLS